MFQFVINARSTRHTWAPVLQRCFAAVALSDHKQIRTMECQNGEKVGNFCKALKVATLVPTDYFLISQPSLQLSLWNWGQLTFTGSYRGIFVMRDLIS